MDLTIVFGFSDNPERYSYKAYHLLKEFNHDTIAFNPRLDDLNTIPKEFDTLTLYVNPELSSKFMEQILKLKFRRIIFNPGTENPEFAQKCSKLGIEVVEGCTLVMLRTDQF